MYKTKKIGCVLLNYNSADETIERLNKIKNYQCFDRIVVVDNSSTDDSKEKLSELDSIETVHIILNNENGGYAKGNNIGIKYLIYDCGIDYICIANPDVSFEEDAIIKLLETALLDKKTGIVSCLIETNATHKPLIAWKLPNFTRCITESLLLSNKICETSHTYNLNRPLQKVDVLCGAFFIAKSTSLIDVDFFDERTFLYYEENILAFKLKEKGYSNYLVTDCSVYHEVSSSINKEFSSYTKQSRIMQNSKLVYCKFYLQLNSIEMICEKLAYAIGSFESAVYKKLRKF